MILHLGGEFCCFFEDVLFVLRADGCGKNAQTQRFLQAAEEMCIRDSIPYYEEEMQMKRHLRTIRGPQGLKGEKGLSAYGVWLKAGHTGTKDDFFSFLRPKPYVYTAKTGQTLSLIHIYFICHWVSGIGQQCKKCSGHYV